MGRILIVDQKDMGWRYSAKKAIPGHPEAENPVVRSKVLCASGDGGPSTIISEYPPGHYEPVHSHPQDEVLFILEGSGHVGATELHPGMFLFIEKDTEYGPLVSEGGMRFLRVGL